MWKELVKTLTDDAVFNPAVSDDDLIDAEAQLGLKLPNDLMRLLLESNGVMGEYGLGLIWDLAHIQRTNIEFRMNPEFKDMYMPFDHFLFFADAGNGDQFAFSIQNGIVQRNDIFAWDHENDSRVWVAPNLKKYLEWWLAGKITL